MPIPLDSPGSAGPPAVKFGEVGSYVDVGIVKVDEVPSRSYDTGETETWPDGNQKTHKRITALVVAAQGATYGKDNDERPVEVGQLVSIYAQSAKYFTYRDAVKEHGAVSVGDVMRWKFEGTKKASNPRHNDVKVFVAKIRAPEGKDGDLLARCESAYYSLADRPTVDAGAGGGSTSYGDEEPF